MYAAEAMMARAESDRVVPLWHRRLASQGTRARETSMRLSRQFGHLDFTRSQAKAVIVTHISLDLTVDSPRKQCLARESGLKRNGDRPAGSRTRDYD